MPGRALKEERERENGRPKPGPADPETRRRMLDARLKEREPEGLYSKERAKPAQKQPHEDTGNLSVFGVGRKLRSRLKRIDDEAS